MEYMTTSNEDDEPPLRGADIAPPLPYEEQHRLYKPEPVRAHYDSLPEETRGEISDHITNLLRVADRLRMEMNRWFFPLEWLSSGEDGLVLHDMNELMLTPEERRGTKLGDLTDKLGKDLNPDRSQKSLNIGRPGVFFA